MVDITKVDLSQVDWERSALNMHIANEIETYAAKWFCREPRDGWLKAACKEYWTDQDLAEVAQRVGTTPENVLECVKAYRD